MSPWILLIMALGQADVRHTKHNLAISSPGTVRAVNQDQICVFCHVPHGASQTRAIWNKDLTYQLSGSLYTLYGSSTLDAVVNRPNGASKLCLTCHDGALALGSLMNLDAVRPATVAMRNGVTVIPAGLSRLGTDLRNDHPVSFQPDLTDPEIVLPPASDAVKLQPGTGVAKDSVQCTSCHDAHLTTTFFLVKQDTRGALCTTCHAKQGWVGSSHENSTAPYPAAGPTTVRDKACSGCHLPHGAQAPTQLLTTQNLSGAALPWAEENVCFSCHRAGGTGVDPSTGRAAPDLLSESQKTSTHQVGLRVNEHQPVFTSRVPAPEPVLNSSRHVECTDCHNPHQARPLPGNTLEGMKGISISGAVVVDDAVTNLKEYEICLRCHGDTFASAIPPAPTRPPSGSNKRVEFQPTNDSFHPVASAGRNQSTVLNNAVDTPSGQLRGQDWTGAPLNRFSTLLCTDCHNSDATTDVLGSARSSTASPKGPHGSAYAPLLRANYDTTVGANAAPYAGYNPGNFALCFICHDGQRLLTTTTNFYQPVGVGAGRGNLHQVHLNNLTHASCHECHGNVHSNVAATNTDFRNVLPGTSTHLINFAPTVRAYPGADPYYGDVPTQPRYGRTPSGDPYCLAGCHDKSTAMDGILSVYRPSFP
jgi:predicted CXXCH cytochrome family protein